MSHVYKSNAEAVRDKRKADKLRNMRDWSATKRYDSVELYKRGYRFTYSHKNWYGSMKTHVYKDRFIEGVITGANPNWDATFERIRAGKEAQRARAKNKRQTKKGQA